MNTQLLDSGDNNLLLYMAEINRQIEFDSSGNAANTEYKEAQIAAMPATVFESEIYSRIDNAIALAPTSTEAERTFKAELIICKALIADKVANAEQ